MKEGKRRERRTSVRTKIKKKWQKHRTPLEKKKAKVQYGPSADWFIHLYTVSLRKQDTLLVWIRPHWKSPHCLNDPSGIPIVPSLHFSSWTLSPLSPLHHHSGVIKINATDLKILQRSRRCRPRLPGRQRCETSKRLKSVPVKAKNSTTGKTGALCNTGNQVTNADRQMLWQLSIFWEGRGRGT